MEKVHILQQKVQILKLKLGILGLKVQILTFCVINLTLFPKILMLYSQKKKTPHKASYHFKLYYRWK